MKAIVVPELSFKDAFKQAEYDCNKAIHDASDGHPFGPGVALSAALAGVQVALNRLKDRLVEAQL